ncbi:Ig-like domain-containing protein [Sporosarcina soli]|uniref:Ig-like domain-containing protein n=1 Tax=Sporosarcina soli TaxID=334736 RepID=A0ABW0TI56_9BACL
MKKFFAIVIAFAVTFSLGSNIKAMHHFDESTDSLAVQGNTYDFAHSSIASTSELSDGQLKGIQIELTSEVMIRGEEQAVKLIGLYNGGAQKTISLSDVELISTEPTVAALSSGTLKALKPGNTVLIARYGEMVDFVTVQVKDFKEQSHKANVPANKIWNVPFNQQIDIQTVKNITVVDSKGVEVPVTHNYLNDKKDSIVQVIPVNGYTPGQRYTIWVKDVRSLSGKSLEYYTKMDFTIKK